MSLRASLVLTTIREPTVLDSYLENLRHHGHLDDVEAYVIPDRKTPQRAYERCAELVRSGFAAKCPTLNEQEAFLQRVGFPSDLIPWDSDNRRNVGFLMALESGSDFMISIDDDNYCRNDVDLFAAHAVVCQPAGPAQVADCDDGWFNVCTLLELDRPDTTYPRGFPYYARHRPTVAKMSTASMEVHINAGLWLLAPDVDAINWLVAPSQAVAFKGPSLVLGHDTWSPINTQNTALRREALGAYYYVKAGWALDGLRLERYSDIFSGYLVQACAKHLGAAIRFGTPVADHRRNAHNYMKDASDEWGFILLFEDVLPWLHDARLSGSTYLETYTALSHCLEEAIEKQRGTIWTNAARGYFHQTADLMRSWVRTVDKFA